MSIRHILAVMRKEIRHIVRDPMTLISVTLTPIILLAVFAYALTVDLKEIPIAVIDYDRSATSRRLVQQITAGEDLVLYAQVDSFDDVEDLLMTGEIKAAVLIDPGFEKELYALKGMPVQIIIDGTEPESGTYALEHIAWRAEEYINTALAAQLQGLGGAVDTLEPIELRVRTWFNPSLKPRVDMIPGLISMVLGLPALSVALTLAHEREHGTMEQLLATPIGRTELLLGKMIPYVLVGMLNVIFIPILSMVWFKIPFNGNFLLFIFLSIFFMFAILSMGTIIGVFIHSQAVALAVSFLLIFFPGFFLTGIFFPTASMPDMMRMESLFMPGTHYAIITRSIFLAGNGLSVLWPNLLMLAGFGLAFTGIAALFFQKKLD